jgi:hypothetical protein
MSDNFSKVWRPQTPGETDARISSTYATVADRNANYDANESPYRGRQRSGSTHYRYRSGSVTREHWHNNAHGGQQFTRAIGGVDRDGNEWGEQPPNGYVV